jgi:hypothetical protein
MARQSGVSTPIFDELLREMTEGGQPAAPPAPASGASGGAAPDPAPKRRHRAD